VATAIGADLAARLPRQNKKQREGLALLVALDVRDVNLMELAAALPRAAARLDMRYQWISRLLGNAFIDTDEMIAPFAREVLARAGANGRTLVLIIDQSQINAEHQMVMVSLRVGGRALPLAWRVKKTSGAIGFAEQRAALDRVAALLPAGVRPVLMGDRFYGSPALIAWCRAQGWDWRLRLKQDLLVFEAGGETTLADCFTRGEHLLSDVELTEQRARTHVAMGSMRRGTPSRGSSPCRSHRPFTGPLTMGCAGASRRCFRPSRPAASTWRTARSRAPTGWTGSCWCCPWRSTGRCQPACGMPSRTEPLLKKDRGDATQKPCPQPNIPVHAGPAAPALLPAAPHRPATTLGYMEI
jgi:hypothetical protein